MATDNIMINYGTNFLNQKMICEITVFALKYKTKKNGWFRL